MKYTLNDNAKKISNYRFFKKLRSLPFVDKIILFGSKAKDNDTPYSDIDLAISLAKDYSQSDWNTVNDIIRYSDTLLKIDCLDLNSLQIDSNLRKNIFLDSIVMFDKNSEKLELAFQKLNDALSSLELAINSNVDVNRLAIDATIQRFEFSFELYWLLLREIIKSKGIKDISFPRDVLIAAFSHQLIKDEKIWVSMLDDRNKTSHTYDKKLADVIYSRVKTYFPIMQSTFSDLKTKHRPKT